MKISTLLTIYHIHNNYNISYLNRYIMVDNLDIMNNAKIYTFAYIQV